MWCGCDCDCADKLKRTIHFERQNNDVLIIEQAYSHNYCNTDTYFNVQHASLL